MLASLATASPARDWQWAPRLSLQERYTDNVRLQPKGAAHSAWITEVQPGLSVVRRGGRIRLDADYSLQGYYHTGEGDRSGLRHNLAAQGRAELVEDWFYLDATARAAQQIIDYAGGIGLGDAVGIRNTAQTFGYTLSPYLRHRFGPLGTLEIRYSLEGYSIDDASGLSDSTSQRYSLRAASGPYFHPLSWSLSYEQRTTDYQRQEDTDSESASAQARLQVSREFGILAHGAWQKYDFPGAAARIRDFSHHGLGLFYTPGRRLSAELAYNWSERGDFVSGSLTLRPTLRTTVEWSRTQQNFGRSQALSLHHRARKSNMGLIYQEGLSSYDQLFLTNAFDAWLCGDVLSFPIAPGRPVPDGCRRLTLTELRTLFGAGAFLPVRLGQTFINKGLTGLYSHEFRRATLSLSVFDQRAIYQGTGVQGREDRRTGLQAALSLRPGERTTLTLSGGYTHLEVDDPNSAVDDREDDYWNLGLTLTRRFQPKVAGSLELRHQQRDARGASQDYRENAVAARLDMRF
ncbi:MAG: TIGR03016 family PEP-CTERM system-associated outer membrane protein [Burkholderiales bacterium]|nr:TIGR03016 family PEP-CTERM system-associated outer membrane protein [Burkholderiales bacterium]